jgi:hypothetical protein
LNLIVICVNYDNEIINNDYGRGHDLILLFEIAMGAPEKISSCFVENLGTRHQTVSPYLDYSRMKLNKGHIQGNTDSFEGVQNIVSENKIALN